MKAIFSPGPSYSDPEVRKVAGWVKILDLYREALEGLGYDVFVPSVPRELIDQSSTVSKILSYDVVAAAQLPVDADLFLGPPGYSLAQMMKLRAFKEGYEHGEQSGRGWAWTPKIFTYVWNNADFWRDQQLAEEYQRFNVPYDLSPTWRWINKTALEMSDHVIACSPWVKKTHARIVPPERISVAFWGVDSQMFSPAKEDPPGFRVLFVGGDPIRKGLRYLLQALESLDNWELWIVGCAPLALDRPSSRFKQFGMVPHSEMPAIMRQCHVLVCPTLEDGIALCVQEAMASGLPVIGTPEVAEVFEDGVSGYMVPYRDADAILKALKLLQDDGSRQATGVLAWGLAKEQSWTQTKNDFKEIIRRVMDGGNLPFESAMPWLRGGAS